MIDTGELQYSEENHVYVLNGRRVPSIHDVLDRFRFTETTFIEAQALIRGTAVHKGIELIEKGTIDWSTVDKELDGYLNAYRLFKSENDFHPTHNEPKAYHSKLLYAGRLDAFDAEHGIIVEYKTGSLPKWTRYQLAAQERALELDEPCERVGVELHADGTYRMERFTKSLDLMLWQSIMSLWNQQFNDGYKMFPDKIDISSIFKEPTK
jgi:hypothetical protein